MTIARRVVLLAVLALVTAGCISQPLKIETRPKSNYDELGEGEGRATGVMLFNLIPIGQNERFVRAYRAAVQSRGGDALLNPEITEEWFWAYVLNGYHTTIKGTVIKYR